MTKTALIIGGSGQIGRAVAARLAADGWRVTAAQRNEPSPPLPPKIAAVRLDREEPGAVAGVVNAGFDAVIDTVAFNEVHARQLLAMQGSVGALVVISSGSVYRDERGRTIDEARERGFPKFPVPIGEDQPTVAPGPATYSTRKAALEETLLAGATTPLTILRPGAIHGPGSRHPREWFFVRRILDGRRVVPLAWNGESRFHTSATVNIAALVAAALETPGARVLNAGDPEALSVTRIGEVIAALYGHEWRLLGFKGPQRGPVGGHPWGVSHPIVLDMTRARTLGYRPVARYEDAVQTACRSAEEAARAGVAFVPYLATMFDYAAEDAFIAPTADSK